ncbi:MAG: peptidoglycan-binding protein [Candidatus Subteraquimicrobiales bacterium]|nr:peptidoglycan-binding protein [Candidatus Subteraquimicrobiales bacterium]
MVCYIKNGSTGVIVKAVQVKLNTLGFYKGRIDSSCGPVTINAIKAYQKAKKLVVDGCCGPVTWKSLFGVDYPNTVKQTVKKGPIHLAVEKKLGSFSNFTGFYNKMKGRGYSHYFNDKKTLTQELNSLAQLNCVDASQLGLKLGIEMGYNLIMKRLVCPKSSDGHIILWGKGKELGNNWVWIDLAAAMSKESMYPIGKAWCQDTKQVTDWKDTTDDGKT